MKYSLPDYWNRTDLWDKETGQVVGGVGVNFVVTARTPWTLMPVFNVYQCNDGYPVARWGVKLKGNPHDLIKSI